MSDKTKKWLIPILCTVFGIILTTGIAWATTTSDRITTSEKDIVALKENIKFILVNTIEIKSDLKEHIKESK